MVGTGSSSLEYGQRFLPVNGKEQQGHGDVPYPDPRK